MKRIPQFIRFLTFILLLISVKGFSQLSVSTVTPDPACRGSAIIISGTGFTNASTVKVKNISVPVTFIDTTKLSVIIPQNTNGGTAQIKVTESGTSKSKTIQLNDIPSVVISSSENNLCEAGLVTLNFQLTKQNNTDSVSVSYFDGSNIVNIKGTGNPLTKDVNITNNQTFTILSVTNHTTGCINTSIGSSVTVTINPSISGALSVSTNEICDGESVDVIFSIVNASGNNTKIYYSKGNNSQTTNTSNAVKTLTFSPSATITYTLDSIEDLTTNCVQIINESQTVTVNQLPTVTLSGGGSLCQGDSTTLGFNFSNMGISPFSVDFTSTSNGNITNYSLTNGTNSNNTIVLTPLANTTYDLVSITDTKGCINTGINGSVTIPVNPVPIATISTSASTICDGTSIDVIFNITNPSGNNLKIYYSKGNVDETIMTTNTVETLTLTPSTTTIYTLDSIEDLTTNCVQIINESKIVTVNQLPTVTLSGTGTTCQGGNITLNFNFGNTGSSPFTVDFTGTSNGNITNYSLPNGTTSNDTVVLIPLDNTTYNLVSITDDNGCINTGISGSATVTVGAIPTASISTNTPTICNGGSTILEFNIPNSNGDNIEITYQYGGFQSIVSGTSSILTETISPSSTTTYSIVEVKNTATNCINSSVNSSVQINVSPLPNGNIAPSGVSTICNGQDVDLGFLFSVGTPPFSVTYFDSLSNQPTIGTDVLLTGINSGNTETVTPINDTDSTISKYYFIRSITDANGCMTTYTSGNYPSTNITINPGPTVNLTGLGAEYVITDNTPVTLTGTPTGGQITGVGVGVTTVNASNSTAIFIPSNITLPPGTLTGQNVTINYNYIDPNTQCVGIDVDTVLIKPAPVFAITSNGLPLNPTMCTNTDSIVIYGKNLSGTLGFNTFQPSPILSNIMTIGDSVRATLSTDMPGNYTLTFGSFFSGFDVFNLTIFDTLETIFSPSLDPIYCEGDDDIILVGIPTGGTFSTSPFIVNGNTFSPRITGNSVITYQFTDNNGCHTRIDQPISVIAKPLTDFEMAIECSKQKVLLTDITTFSSSTTDYIDEWIWNFGDGIIDTLNTHGNINYIFPQPGTYDITLITNTAEGCTGDFTLSATIGTVPDVDFDWINATLGDTTVFTNLSTIITAGGNKIDSLMWNFGDGIIIKLDSASGNIIKHQFANTGVYNVSLIAFTNNECVDSVSHRIYILPKVDTYPYFEQFNASNGEWVPENDDETENFDWEWGHPEGNTIFHEDIQNNAWATRLDTFYRTDQNCWIHSPTFDFTNLEVPIIVFTYWNDTRISDGLILQSSIDSGRTWIPVGNIGSGLEWFNRDNIVSQPGNQLGLNGLGWTEQTEGWVVARHKLDDLKGNSSVRFRLAFSSVSGINGVADGFAFDDVWIGERQRRVLVEHFTNTSINNHELFNNSVYQRLDNNSKDVIGIEYHTSFPGNDMFHNFNPADPSARALYYEFSQTLKTVIDGDTIFPTITTGTNLAWSQEFLDLTILKEPIFNVTIDNFSINGNTLTVKTTAKARSELNSDTLKIHIAVIEDSLTNDGDLHRNVVRRLLPNATGTTFTNSWGVGTEQSVTETWTFNTSDVNPNNLEVVTWIQNERTKEIYQATSSTLPNITFDTTIVNTNIVTPLNESDFKLYPNPTNYQFVVAFEQPLEEDAYWRIFDINGRLIKNGNLPKFTRIQEIDVQNMASGLYFFRIDIEGQKPLIKKLSVIK